MEGVIDVYEKHFTDSIESNIYYVKKNTHTCLICRHECEREGSYGKSDRETTEKNIIEYLEHLNVYGSSKKLAQIFIDSVRDSGILCKKVSGWWEFKEHHTYYVYIIEHSVEF